MTTNIHFKTLIESAIALTREGTEQARMSPDFIRAMDLLKSKTVRLELRISFDPAPAVVCDLVRDEDGECVGHLFRHEARSISIN